MEMDATADVLAALDTLILRRNADGGFTRVGAIPEWIDRLGKPSFEGVHCDDALEAFPILQVFLDEAAEVWDPPREGEWVRSDFWTERTSSGEEVHLAAAAVMIDDAPLLVIQRDEDRFDEHRALLQRAREVRSTLDQLGREMDQKEVLVHCIVHDLASPLGAIVAALSVLGNRTLDRDASDLVQLAMDAANQQRGLIREILDVFTTERGGTHSGADTLALDDVRAAVTAAVATLTANARSRGIEITQRFVDDDAGGIVTGEARRFERVVANLVDNAVRFSPDGARVTVTTTSMRNGVHIDVEDDGPGVPPGFVTQLFQKFSRTQDREHPGTGLGLYFCRITVEEWGGAIGYAAREGGGARFWVELPRVGA
jgi:signal transduction histidine kinase